MLGPEPGAAQTKRVLVVDDDADIREPVTLTIELAGWEPIEAPDGHRGVALAVAMQPDAILLDVMMPGMDGQQTLAELRSHPETQGIPLVFLTAKTIRPERSLSEYDVCRVVEKPFGAVHPPPAVTPWSDGHERSAVTGPDRRNVRGSDPGQDHVAMRRRHRSVRLRPDQLDLESRTMAPFADQSDRTAVSVCDGPRDGKSQPKTPGPAVECVTRAGEPVEDARLFSGRYTRAVVHHAHHHAAAMCADTDDDVPALVRVLDGVRQEVVQEAFQSGGVTRDVNAFRGMHGH